MKTLAEHWRDYEVAYLDPMNAGSLHRIETQRSFYAGCAAALLNLWNAGDNSVLEDDAVVMSRSMSREIEVFRLMSREIEAFNEKVLHGTDYDLR